MKRLLIVCTLIFTSVVSPCFAIQYCKDFLEHGNPGGWTNSLQTYDDEWNISVGEEVDLDIWINDCPEPLVTGGFWFVYDPATISVISINVYELFSVTQGPWDPEFTTVIPDADGPGTLFVACGNFDPVAVGPGGDILIAKVRIRCEAKGDTPITLSTFPGFDTVVGISGWNYDPEIEPNTIAIQQECTVDEDCDDITVCTDDSCDQIIGACVNNPSDANCDDGIACTEDVCDPVHDCQFIPNDDDCPDDGLFCTGIEFCDGVADCSSRGNPCTLAEICDEGSDQCVAGAPGWWWNTAWPYRKELTIDNTKVDEDLTNFPVLIDLTDAEVAANAQSNGEDIVFIDINGTILSHEIELYDDGTGQLIAWVNVESLSSTVDTTLFMYFGNSDVTSSQEDVEGSWDSNYVMVQHLEETSPDIHNDSTSHNNDGAPSVTTQGIALGQIDGADEFDGTDDLVVVPDSTTLDITGSMTVEAWALSTGGTGPNRILAKDVVGTPGKFILWRNPQGDLAFLVADDSGVTNPWHRAIDGPITDGVWFHVVGVFDAVNQKVRLYKDGALVVEVPGPISIQSNTETVTIGASDDNDHNWEGTIDEVRISNVVRSAGWILTSYTNQGDPTSFTEMGDVENQCEGNFDCDEDCDGSDASLFKTDFGRSNFGNPCESSDSCNGDFDCDHDVDGTDAHIFKTDFGRSPLVNPCPACIIGEWCVYQ